MTKNCPLCNLKNQKVSLKGDSEEKISYKCARCGKFTITHKAELLAKKKKIGSKISSWIRNLHEMNLDIPEITADNITEIEQSIPEYNPSDKQYLFLSNIVRKSRYPGDCVSLSSELDYPLAWASAPEEILFYIRFLIERGLLTRISQHDTSIMGNKSISVAATMHGWEYLEQYEQRAIELSQAFVAMSFSEAMKKVWDKAIKPAVNEAGYKACLVDSEKYGDKVNAKIISEIRNSLFVIAEVSEHKHVIYFEAGYAIGRNLPVIWCVRKKDLVNVHFDTRQNNHVVWETAEDLKEKLYDIICAVVGRRKKI